MSLVDWLMAAALKWAVFLAEKYNRAFSANSRSQWYLSV